MVEERRGEEGWWLGVCFAIYLRGGGGGGGGSGVVTCGSGSGGCGVEWRMVALLYVVLE